MYEGWHGCHKRPFFFLFLYFIGYEAEKIICLVFQYKKKNDRWNKHLNKEKFFSQAQPS